MPVRRVAQIVHLKPEALAAYKECHANVWPEVLQQIKECNIRDCPSLSLTPPVLNSHPSIHPSIHYTSLCFVPRRAKRAKYDCPSTDRVCEHTDSIFYDNDRTLFATFKYVGDDWDGDMKRMHENPKVREWWAMTDGMQVFPPPLIFPTSFLAW